MMKSPCFLQLIPGVFIGCRFHSSEVVLEQCTKEQLLRITDHFNTEIGGICFEAKSEKYPQGCSIDVGILTNEKC